MRPRCFTCQSPGVTILVKRNLAEANIYLRNHKAYKSAFATHALSLAAVEGVRFPRKSAMKRIMKRGVGGRKP